MSPNLSDTLRTTKSPTPFHRRKMKSRRAMAAMVKISVGAIILFLIAWMKERL